MTEQNVSQEEQIVIEDKAVDVVDNDTAEKIEPVGQESPEADSDDSVIDELVLDADEPKADEVAEPAQDSKNLREVRAALKRAEAERKRLKRELEEVTKAKAPEGDVQQLKEPDLWDDGIDGDKEILKQRMREYLAAEAKVEAQKQEQLKLAQQEQQQAREKLQNYRQAYDAIIKRNPEASGAEEVAYNTLTLEQQAIIFETAESPAMAARIVYQLGMGLLSGSKEAADIAANTTNYGKFTKSIGLLEYKIMNNTKKKAVPAPEKTVKDTTPVVASEKKLEELFKKAQQSPTKNFDEYFEYQRSLKKVKNE